MVTYTDTTTSSIDFINADFVVMAVDMRRYFSLLQDPSQSETDAFSGLEGSLFLTTLFDSDPAQPVERPTFEWVKRMHPEPARDGLNSGARLYVQRNDANFFFGKGFKGSDGTTWYGNVTGRQRRVAYQWMGGVTSADLTQWTNTLLKDFAQLGQTNVVIHTQAAWPYHTHYTQAALKAGNLWKVWDMQGERNTLWVGSSVSFEVVIEVLLYNVNLSNRIVAI